MKQHFVSGFIFEFVVFLAETVKHLTFNQIYYGNMLGFSNFLDVLVTTVLGYFIGIIVSMVFKITHSKD